MRTIVFAGAVMIGAFGWCADARAQPYQSCLETEDIAVCIAVIAESIDPSDIDRNDLVAVGAVDLLHQRGETTAAQVASIFAGDTPTTVPDFGVLRRIESVGYALDVLPLFRSDAFAALLGLAGDGRSLAPRDAVRLFWIAREGDHEGTERRILVAADPGLARSDDELAEFAMVAAHFGALPGLAEAYLQAGGADSARYDIDGIRHAIDIARLHQAYDASIAARVLRMAVEDDHPVGWPSDEMEALRAAGAVAELRTLAEARIARARDPERGYGSVTDLAAAAWLLDAAGDRTAATEVALESLDLAGEPGAWAAELLFAFGRLEIDDEALSGQQRYQAALSADVRPDPRWIVGDTNDVRTATIILRRACQSEPATALRSALLERMDSDVDAYDIVWGSQLAAVLAGIAGDREAVSLDLARALGALDRMDREQTPWTAVQVAIAYRSALQLLDCRAGST